MTIREIIAAAMRRGKILASGETPSADEERSSPACNPSFWNTPA